jgi:succinate dehydrogenase/fumarate reductase cytochrome b subunit
VGLGGFLLYRHGMRLAAQEYQRPGTRPVSKKSEVFVVVALVAAAILLGFAAWHFFTKLS